MKEHLRKQVDWPQPFPPEEYAERRKRVRAALAEAKLDAVYVTIPADLAWLTGYDMIWFHLQNLTGLLVRADRDETLFFDGVGHTTIVSTTPEIREVVWFARGDTSDHVALIADTLKARGLGAARIALQPWAYSPHATVMDELSAKLKGGGASVADGHQLVEALRLVKSPREIAVMKEAAAIADAGMAAGRDAIAAGAMETEIEAAIMAAAMRKGAGYPGIRTMIGTGPRAGTHHSPATHRRIKRGDLVFVDFCGVLHRYHVNLNRTFSLGAPDARWTALMDTSAGCIDAILAEVKVGDPWSKVDKVGQRYLDETNLRKYVWWAGGYNQGIAFPPDWCGTYWIEPRRGTPDRPLVPGMFFNYENQFDVWEDWPGGSGAAYIETLMVTEKGLEVMSRLPRTLVTV
jgi:Xaa-Pro aminopeptidase